MNWELIDWNSELSFSLPNIQFIFVKLFVSCLGILGAITVQIRLQAIFFASLLPLSFAVQYQLKFQPFAPHFELTDMIAEFSLLLLFFNLLRVIWSGSSSSTNLYAGSTIHAAVLGNRIESTISTRHFCFSTLVISGWTDFELGFFKVWYPFTLCCVNTLTLHKSLLLV